MKTITNLKTFSCQNVVSKSLAFLPCGNQNYLEDDVLADKGN